MLIKDQGKVRKCAANRVQLGYWSSLKEFHSYSDSWARIEWSDYAYALKELIGLFVFLVIFPITPFVLCYLEQKKAARDVELESKIEELHNAER